MVGENIYQFDFPEKLILFLAMKETECDQKLKIGFTKHYHSNDSDKTIYRKP